MHSFTFKQGAEMTFVNMETTASDNPYYESSACPEALSTISRSAVLVRDINEPIQFPYGVEVISGYVPVAG